MTKLLCSSAKEGTLCNVDVILFVCSIVCRQRMLLLMHMLATALLSHVDNRCPKCFFPHEKLSPPVKFMPTVMAHNHKISYDN